LAFVLGGVILVAACAVVEPPPGGPVDKIRPHVQFMIPDSASTGLGEIRQLNFTFSEKMDRISAVTWLHFFPDQRIDKTKWHGATRADITLEQPLPPDTVIVVEIAAGMRDAHKVANRRGRRYPIATGDSIPVGKISGVLVMADSAVSNGVVELYAIPPDTLAYFEQNMLRRTVTDNTGTYDFRWLPVPGGPWLLRGYADDNGDLRPGDKEAQRLLPDTLSIDVANSTASAGVTTLYPVKTPGRFLIAPFSQPDFPGQMRAWSMHVTEKDTGWVPAPLKKGKSVPLDPESETPVSKVPPGTSRLLVFVDMDGDSTFSGIADSLLGRVPAETDADSVSAYYLEPWLMLENLEIEPGLDTPVTLPATAYSLTPWAVVPAATDSMAVTEPASGDSTAVTDPEEATEGKSP